MADQQGFLKSFVCAIQGLRAALKEQRNLKIQLLVALVVINAGFYCELQRWEWCAVFICIGLVVGFEMMNSAIESLVDLVTREHNPLAGKAKDIAAAAVLVVSIAALIVGCVIFSQYLF